MPRATRSEVNSLACDPSSTKSLQSLNNSSVQLDTTPDFARMTTTELLKAITARNTDPVTNEMLCALADKIPRKFSEFVESEKRERSLVFAGS
ncbi:unnamed protein product [Haemonchus placei]|uniref:Uncharacterized protein n=1 Tax=Haemonchus placei TaxID=6290 RepID=A0A0N4WQV7_HAEPC|nr:unnamed protein product [Haemonchus placei]